MPPPRNCQVHLSGGYFCSVVLGAACHQPATHLVLVTQDGRVWESKGRCADHPAQDAVVLLERAMPWAQWVVVPLTRAPSRRQLGATRAGR